MKIAQGMHSLGGTNGAQSYLFTAADQMQRNGHDVWVYAEEGGDGEDRALGYGLRVVHAPRELPEDLDVFFAHDLTTSLELLDARPAVPQLFIWHGNLFDDNLPPQLNGAIKRVVTLNSMAHRRFDGLAVRPPVVALKQPVNPMEFRSQGAIRAEKPRVMSLSNYLGGKQKEIAEKACELAGLEFRLIGAQGEGPTLRPQDAINEADIVLGKGRAVVEAMSCGRAAYVFDMFGGDGWITPDSYERLVAANFSGSLENNQLSAEDLAEDLKNYEPSMGEINRQLAVSEHSSSVHASKLIAACEEVIAENGGAVKHDDLYELHRLTRVSWRHEADAFALGSKLERRSLEMGDLSWELEKTKAELETTKTLLESAQRMADSRRVTLINKLFRPIDKLRGRV